MRRDRLFMLAALVLCADCTFSANAAPAPAKVRHYYGFYDDGGEHPADTCNITDELPTKLAKQKEFAASENYVGSEQIEFAEHNEAAIDAWRHYFSSAAGCDKAVKKSYRNYVVGE